MSDLSPEARALVEAGRDGWCATADDRARILSKLSAAAVIAVASSASEAAAAAASGAPPPVAAPGGAPAVGQGASLGRIASRVLHAIRTPAYWPLIGMPVVGSGLVFYYIHVGSTRTAAIAAHRGVADAPAAVVVQHETPVPDATAQSAGGAGAQPADPPAAVDPAEASGLSSSALAKNRKDVSAVRERARDRLQDEVALLSKAEADLYNGHPRQALETLDEHERRFRNGALAEERMAAQIRAFCALGRWSEAKGQIDRLVRISPRSPYLARAREACKRVGNRE